MNEKIKEIIRWILVLPSSIVSWIIAILITSLMIWLFHEHTIDVWYGRLLSNFISAFCFVYVGTVVAPRKRRIVCIVLCTILVLFYILAFTLNITWYKDLESLSAILGNIASMIGCIFACYHIYKEYD